MASKVVTKAFRELYVCDLTDLTKGNVKIEQATMLSHDGNRDTQPLYTEDSDVPFKTIPLKLTGNIKIEGYIEAYAYSKSAAGAITEKKLFESLHYYLIRALGINVDAEVPEMLYMRWIGQLIQFPKQERKTGEITPQTVELQIVTMSSKRWVDDIPYIATSTSNSLATADHDSVFTRRIVDTTKTLAAAETEIGGIVNPFT